jgi:hypothetical protein
MVASSTNSATDEPLAGMPCNVPCGIGCSRPPLKINGRAPVVATCRSASPSSASNAGTSGRLAMNASAPTSTHCPPIRSVRSTPPRRSAGSNTVMDASGPAAILNR